MLCGSVTICASSLPLDLLRLFGACFVRGMTRGRRQRDMDKQGWRPLPNRSAPRHNPKVASALERNEAACRQLAARTRASRTATHGHAAPCSVPSKPPGSEGGQLARPDQIDAKHAQLLSAFAAATQSGDLDALTQPLARDVRVVTDGGGKVRAAPHANSRG